MEHACDHYRTQRDVCRRKILAQYFPGIMLRRENVHKFLNDFLFRYFFPSHAFLRLRRKKALIKVRNRRDFENGVK